MLKTAVNIGCRYGLFILKRREKEGESLAGIEPAFTIG